MRIVDRKGRLFGKINVIDLAVILAVLYAIPLFYYGYKAFVYKEVYPKQIVHLVVEFEEVIPDLAKVINEGDEEKKQSGKVLKKITQIVSSKPAEVLILADKEVLESVKHPYKKDIKVTMDVLCEKRGQTFYFNDDPVRIGEQITFSTSIYYIEGQILDIEQSKK